MKKGVFCISIDTELLWGRKDSDYSKFIQRTKEERKVITKLLKLFQKYNTPVTWAVVGKMLEKPPREQNDNDLWYGKDIIKMIKKYKIHELASHSYSHPEFTNLTKEEAEKEIKKTKTKSFVFPKNKINFLEILTKYKFISYRGKDKSNLELLIPRIPPVVGPTLHQKLVNIAGSMYFVSGRGMRCLIPPGLRFLKSFLGLQKAMRQRKVFHLWFHPVDLVDNDKLLFWELEKILKYASFMENKGWLNIMTMEQIALLYKRR